MHSIIEIAEIAGDLAPRVLLYTSIRKYSLNNYKLAIFFTACAALRVQLFTKKKDVKSSNNASMRIMQ